MSENAIDLVADLDVVFLVSCFFGVLPTCEDKDDV